MARQELAFGELIIPVREIYSFMGFGENDEPDAVTAATTAQLLAEAATFLRPSFEYHFFDGHISDSQQELVIEGPSGTVTFSAGKIICRQLRSASRFAVFVATVGEGYFKWTDAVRSRDDVFQTYVADCIGSQVVESAADCMEKVLQGRLEADGLKRTNRYSPGYCGWHVSEQPKLFSLFPDRNPCGIELTDSCLMLPVKSVSGIIGIGPEARLMPYSCNICTMKMCFRRHRK